MTVPSRHKWLLFAATVLPASAAVAVVLAFSGAGADYHRPLTLTSFRQPDAKDLVMDFNEPISTAYFSDFPDVPSAISPSPVSRNAAIRLGKREIELPLREDQIKRQYSIVAYINNRHIEFVRQPAIWLEDKFSFYKPNGYTILGRRSVAVRSGQRSDLSDVSFAGIPSINLTEIGTEGLPRAITQYPSLVAAAQLVRLLWELPIYSGPTSKSYDNFLRNSFNIKMSELRDGDYPAMCAGMRDLFLHATTAIPGIKARGVDAVNYAPPFPDLVSYGHSTAEVWVQQLHQWAIIDPWMGIALIDDSGRPLSAEELRDIDPARVHPAALITTMTRFYHSNKGKTKVALLHPADTKMTGFTTNSDGLSPGYLIYFHHLSYRKFKVEQ